ncbi:MAG: hypothetical protein Hyperionvirus2_123 [Hyperionvirus sp.]|uniref:Uncharacterized protein n=1 Tax=Hyperionvirus sp. TaxID=2487770 RepID=A0A3G5A677_9VIRU|nr:MAG: hypothetical protein Hyperionvirus2_123 [Hyperionvirus sp.]
MKDKNGFDLSIRNETGCKIEITDETTDLVVKKLKNCSVYGVKTDPENGPIENVTISRAKCHDGDCECGFVKLRNLTANTIVIADPLGSSSGSLEPYGSIKIYNERVRSRCLKITGVSYEQVLTGPEFLGRYENLITFVSGKPIPLNHVSGNLYETLGPVLFRADHKMPTKPENIRGSFTAKFIMEPDSQCTMTLTNVELFSGEKLVQELDCLNNLILTGVFRNASFPIILRNEKAITCLIEGIQVRISVEVDPRINFSGSPAVINHGSFLFNLFI